uniref:A-kinase anchor protein 17A n=1 Tax=Denticeps clupeoides TaxID=299321 RepID=A0AAY4DUW3_9TELE
VAMTTIVHDTTEAVKLCPEYNLYLKPIAKMTISVALPQLKMPGKSISNWEVMERLKSMIQPDQFSSLRISKSTMDFIRFEGEVENKSVVKKFISKLDGKSIKLSGFTDILKIRAAENKADFPTRHDWDAFFRDAKDMNETVPGERPDTIHLEGLPCKWFAQKDCCPDRPAEAVLWAVFESFGKIRNVDIPMLDPYREEMTDKNFNTFTFGGHLNFEGYVQYQEYFGFTKAMDALRGMKLMHKGDDGKAVACNIKVTFDTTKHLSDLALKRRQQERLKLQELERQREEQKRREKEEEERRREEERQRELEEEEKERRREEKVRKREQKLKEREEKRNQKKVKKLQEEEQKKLQLKIALEERKLLLAQRNLESIQLIAELLSRAKALKQQQKQELQERRQQQEAELRRVEGEKARALELQKKERELRDRLLTNMLKKSASADGAEEGVVPAPGASEDVAQVNGVHRTKGDPAPDVNHVWPKEPGNRAGVQKKGDRERRGTEENSHLHTQTGRRRSQGRHRTSPRHSHGRSRSCSVTPVRRSRDRRRGSGLRRRSNSRRQTSSRGRSYSTRRSSDSGRSSSGGGDGSGRGRSRSVHSRPRRRGKHDHRLSRSRRSSSSSRDRRGHRHRSHSRDKDHSRRH